MKQLEELKAALSVASQIAKELDGHEHHSESGLLGAIRGKAVSALEALEHHENWLKENPEAPEDAKDAAAQ